MPVGASGVSGAPHRWHTIEPTWQTVRHVVHLVVGKGFLRIAEVRTPYRRPGSGT
jgi:hypothetical protein